MDKAAVDIADDDDEIIGEDLEPDETFTSNDFGILDSIPDMSTYKSFTDRYFSKRYVTNVNGIKNNDIMIMFHSNRVALLSLAPSHFFFKNKHDYIVNYDVGKMDRRKNVVRGKGKKGGQMLMANTVICKIDYNDGTSFKVPAGMKGTLIEVNEQLVESPELLREQPDADGYIAVILSSISNSDAAKNEMLTPEQYENVLKGKDPDAINEDTIVEKVPNETNEYSVVGNVPNETNEDTVVANVPNETNEDKGVAKVLNNTNEGTGKSNCGSNQVVSKNVTANDNERCETSDVTKPIEKSLNSSKETPITSEKFPNTSEESLEDT